MFLSLICLLLGLALVWVKKRWDDRNSIRLVKYFSFSKWQMLFGFGSLFKAKTIIKKFTQYAQDYGKNLMVYSGPFLFLVTSDPITIKDILTSKNCICKPDLVYDGLRHVIGRGLITLDGDDWIHDRKILDGAFKIVKLKTFIPRFNSSVIALFQNIDGDIESGKKSPLIRYLREQTMSFAAATVLGRDVVKSKVDIASFAESVVSASEYLSDMTSNFIYLNRLVRTLAANTIYKHDVDAIDETINIITESATKFPKLRGTDPSYIENFDSVVDVLARATKRNEFPAEHTTMELFHVLIGAFETSSGAAYFCLLMLAMHPEIQQLAYEEVCRIFPDDDEGHFEVTYEHLGQLEYLSCVINETLRICPVISQVGRKVVGGDVTLSNGAVLPEGQRIMIDIYNLHRSKEIWGPNALKFQPDNFLIENVRARHPFAFIPFTKGIRSCIGIRYAEFSVKITLARFIKRYKLYANAKIEDLVFENHISLHLPKHPEMKIERRKMSKP
ncbi:probable cytochrome P450 313a4 [Stomoxys calcitrans]|uniref:probable cytochrome P450 313a4 n=1 Tax=Stomoxys calcitrans TaxID=35570 RepID=UPI0027E3607D|nr:probable cytochrome P450 313a4 [Stomoxys calcitrans]